LLNPSAAYRIIFARCTTFCACYTLRPLLAAQHDLERTPSHGVPFDAEQAVPSRITTELQAGST
jgi:hypothetical protein